MKRQAAVDSGLVGVWRAPDPEQLVYLKELIKHGHHHKLPPEKKMFFWKFNIRRPNDVDGLSKATVDLLISVLHGRLVLDWDWWQTPAG